MMKKVMEDVLKPAKDEGGEGETRGRLRSLTSE